jgi:hypothetical protein
MSGNWSHCRRPLGQWAQPVRYTAVLVSLRRCPYTSRWLADGFTPVERLTRVFCLQFDDRHGLTLGR